MKTLDRAWSWIKSRARLVIEYVLIGMVVALAGWAVASYFQYRAEKRELVASVRELSTSLGSVSTTLDQQVQTNRDQDVAIAELDRLRTLDGQAIQGLQADLARARSKDRAFRAKVDQLEKNNAAAKSLLDTTVPRALGCVLDGTPCADRDDADRH